MLPIFLLALSCTQVTAGGLVQFHAAAAGPAEAVGGPLSFHTRAGYDVTLSTAQLHIGAVYLNRTVPLTSERESSCILPGTYVGQIASSVDVDLLRADPVAFPLPGVGLADHAAVGEVWLTGNGDVNADVDKRPIFVFEGQATNAAGPMPFRGSFTIGQNRKEAPRSVALPGSNPICQERIVTGIAVNLQLTDEGTLTLRVDPRAIFADVDFGQLAPDASGLREFVDADEGQPSIAAYFALRSSVGVYSFEFAP